MLVCVKALEGSARRQRRRASEYGVRRAVREEDSRRVRGASKTYLVIKSLKAEV